MCVPLAVARLSFLQCASLHFHIWRRFAGTMRIDVRRAESMVLVAGFVAPLQAVSSLGGVGAAFHCSAVSATCMFVVLRGVNSSNGPRVRTHCFCRDGVFGPSCETLVRSVAGLRLGFVVESISSALCTACQTQHANECRGRGSTVDQFLQRVPRDSEGVANGTDWVRPDCNMTYLTCPGLSLPRKKRIANPWRQQCCQSCREAPWLRPCGAACALPCVRKSWHF